MKIPTYDAPQVEERALPGVRQSSVVSPGLLNAAAEREGATGRAMLGAGAALMQVAAQQQDRQNADMLFRAETSLKDDYLGFEQSVRERKGQAAWGAAKDTEQWFAEQEKKHSESLENDVQRKLFGQSITKLRQSAVGSVSTYESAERRRSVEESARASIVGSINMAAATAAEGMLAPLPTPEAATEDSGGLITPPTASNPIAGFKSDIIKRVQVLASLNGWSPERKAAEEALHVTNLHKQVIQNLVDRDPTKARDYFTANKAEINGSDLEQIGKVLKIGETKQAGFEFAERTEIRALATDQERIAAAREVFKNEPEKREAAISEIKTRSQEDHALRERGQALAADQAWGIYARTGRLNAIPATTIDAMDGHAYATLKEHARLKAEGYAIKTDFGAYYDLRQMAASDPDAFRKVDLRGYMTRLSPGDLEEMAKLQTSSPKEAKDAATLTQQLSNTHDVLKWGISDKEKKGLFDKAVTDAVNAAQATSGKTLDYPQRQQIIDRLVIEGDTNGWMPFGNKRFFEVQGTPDAGGFVPKISDADKQAIVTRFTKRAGRAPTETEILQTFKTWKGL